METTCILVNKRFSVRQDPARDQTIIWRLVRTINVSLNGDWILRAEEEGKDV